MEGTRHTLLTALAQGGMSERMLRAFSRHRDGKSLDHYAKPKITREAIVRALPSPAARADASPRWSG